jgi:hypothetical protein
VFLTIFYPSYYYIHNEDAPTENCIIIYFVLIGYVVVWQHVLRVACVLCAVHNGTEDKIFSQAPYKLPEDG